MSRVIVVGGGIVGASATYHLAKSGIETVLVDRFDLGQATAAGAGIISPGSSLTTASSVLDYADTAVPFYPGLVADLAEIGQKNTGYGVVGELICARNAEEMGYLEAVRASYAERFQYTVAEFGPISMIEDRKSNV